LAQSSLPVVKFGKGDIVLNTKGFFAQIGLGLGFE
jgi:hypothetical protein